MNADKREENDNVNDWREEYRRKVMSADDAVKLVKSGERWATTHATAESMVLAEALCRRLMNWRMSSCGKAQLGQRPVL